MASTHPEDRGEYRSFFVAMVDAPEFQDLSAAARSCLVIGLKMRLGRAGIGVFYPEQLPRLTGFDLPATDAALAELERTRWLVHERMVYWIRNGLRFEPSKPLDSPNQRRGIEIYLGTLPKLPIVNDFARYYELEVPFPELDNRGGSPPPSGTPRKPFRNPFEAGMRDEVRGKREEGDAAAASPAHARTPEEIEDQAGEIIRAANRGMDANPSIRHYNPIPQGHGSRSDVVEWLTSGIPAGVILEVVEAGAAAYQPDRSSRQISSMRYFGPAVAEEWERRQSKSPYKRAHRSRGRARPDQHTYENPTESIEEVQWTA